MSDLYFKAIEPSNQTVAELPAHFSLENNGFFLLIKLMDHVLKDIQAITIAERMLIGLVAFIDSSGKGFEEISGITLG